MPLDKSFDPRAVEGKWYARWESAGWFAADRSSDKPAPLRAVAEDRTTLSIAHRLSTIADADRIFVLDQGRLAEAGTHLELLRRDGLYAEMWARQAAEKAQLEDAAE